MAGPSSVLSLLQASTVAVTPDSQIGFVSRAETLQFTGSAAEATDVRQYQHLLAVADSQEQRLVRHGALRCRPGYDLSDPWLAVTADADGSHPSKTQESRRLIPGMPCQLVGQEGVIVAYLGPEGDTSGSSSSKRKTTCQVRLPGGDVVVHGRCELLPLPTRSAVQGDWVLIVDLPEDQARLNGMRGICGLGGCTPSGERGFWVMLEASQSNLRPEMLLLASKHLVALAGPSGGATKTPWEARRAVLGGADMEGCLEDEAAAEARREQRLLILCDGKEEDEEDEDDKSMDLSDEDSEADAHSQPIEAGSLVRAQLENGLHFARVESLEEAQGSECTATVKLLEDGTRKTSPCRSDPLSCAISALSVLTADQATLDAVCSVCRQAEPEAELLICEGFCVSCVSTIHTGCLKPPLRKVPQGPWHCFTCTAAQPPKRRAAEAGLEAALPEKRPKAKAVTNDVKAGAKAKPKATFCAKAKGKATARRK